MEEPPQEHALTRDRLLNTNRQVHPLVDRTIEVVDSCCRKWANLRTSVIDLHIAHVRSSRLARRSVTRSIKWRCKKAYSDAMKHNLAFLDAEVSLQRD